MVDEGVALSEAYLKDYSDKGNIHSLLGALYIKKGDLDKAVSEFGKQIEFDHHPEMGYLNLGMALIKKGSEDEALQAFKKSIELNPRNPRVHYQLGTLYEKKGMKEEAEKEMAIYKGLMGQ